MAAGALPTRTSAARRRRIVVENAQAWLFLLPALVVLAVFKLFPALFAVWISLFKWDIIQGPFRGIENYTAYLWADATRSEQFWRALSTTFTYLIVTIPLEMGLALVVAYVLFQKLSGRAVYRTLYYLPYVTSTVAAAAVFFWIFHPQYGLANALLSLVGIGRQQWLQEPDGVFQMIGGAFGVQVPDLLAGPSLALVAIAIFSVWHFLGFQIVIFLAGLGNIPAEYYEAARIDGASDRQLFTKITLPLLSPQIFFVFTIASIGVLRAFNEIYVFTFPPALGGPLDTTKTLNVLVFRTFFQQGQIGLGSALAVILTVIILLFTLIQFRVFERRVVYG